jgi:class 3 adenylate cyclase
LPKRLFLVGFLPLWIGCLVLLVRDVGRGSPYPELLAALGVGVGVATGRAWVGSVGSADRLLWTALGNTTNLASRLQALTQELGAPLVIDESTWRAAGDAARPYQRRPDVAIRGRRRPETLYVLARAAAGQRLTSPGSARGPTD